MVPLQVGANGEDAGSTLHERDLESRSHQGWKINVRSRQAKPLFSSNLTLFAPGGRAGKSPRCFRGRQFVSSDVFDYEICG